MEDNIANAILIELREFRTENEKRWEENNKKWEQNEARWEENNKKWEQNEVRWEENNKKWEQNEARWEENNKKWEQNEARWEENNKKWEQNEVRWKENNARWEANDVKWKENDTKLEGMNQRITSLEEGCKKDRKDLLEILDTMQKTIDNQFREMREYFDAKFDKVFVSQRVNDIEHEEFKKLVYTHEDRLNFYNARINQIQEWKEQFHGSQLTVV